MFEGRRNTSATQSYSFNIVAQGNTPPTPLTGTALTLGSTITDSISAAGELDNYQFTLASPTTLYFDNLSTNGNLRWSLRSTAAIFVNSRSFLSSDSVDITDPQIACPRAAIN